MSLTMTQIATASATLPFCMNSSQSVKRRSSGTLQSQPLQSLLADVLVEEMRTGVPCPSRPDGEAVGRLQRPPSSCSG